MKIKDEEAHKMRFVWCWGKEHEEFSTFCFSFKRFGDRPVVDLTEEASPMVIKEGDTNKEIDRMINEISEDQSRLKHMGAIPKVFMKTDPKPNDPIELPKPKTLFGEKELPIKKQ